ncbi:hypothetical protein [Halobaculum sp. MBLA0143]|uniref:hypothetical protein n=1 Tax=Halobaculum sp. MBLA0143 TaxID=3079933 RepID=UPI0035259D21
MSGHVAFGEGRNDAYFMQKTFERCNVDPEVMKFVAEDEEGQEISFGQQERALRDFRRNDQDYFVKSEGGDAGLYDVFAYSAEKIVTGQFEVTLVLDLDTDSSDATVADVQASLDEQFDGSMEWRERECHEEVGDLWLGAATLADVNTEDGAEFSLVAFENDVEAAVGCSSDDPQRERYESIRDYVGRPEVVRALVSLYG